MLARGLDNGLKKVGDRWQAVAYHQSLPGRKAQETFDSKTEAKAWKQGLESDLRKIHPESSVRYDKKKSVWTASIPSGDYAGRWYAEEIKDFGTPAKAQAHETQTIADRNAGARPKEERERTLGDVLDEWLKKHKGEVEYTTFAKDKGLIENHIRPHLGRLPILTVDLNLLEDWKDDLCEAGCSGNTISIVIKKLSQIFSWAVPRQYAKFNPVSGLKSPSVERAKWTPLTEDQIEDLCDLTASRSLILSLVYTSLRIGELVALQVKHVRQLEEESRHLVIEQHLALTETGVAIVKGTKTHQNRDVAIIEDFVPIVQELMRGKGPEDFLFNGLRASDPKKHLNENTFRRNRLSPAFETMGVTGSFHLLRKTSACLLLKHFGNSDDAISKISKCLGHKDITTTLKFYVDIYKGGTQEAMKSLNGLFNSAKGNKAALEELAKASKTNS